jgi:hypothetical protein
MANTEGELARLAARTMRADEMLHASRRLMAAADGSHWSQAAAHHGRALYAQGHIADALAMFEQAWHAPTRSMIRSRAPSQLGLVADAA